VSHDCRSVAAALLTVTLRRGSLPRRRAPGRWSVAGAKHSGARVEERARGCQILDVTSRLPPEGELFPRRARGRRTIIWAILLVLVALTVFYTVFNVGGLGQPRPG
jgi:hypothetical protein